MAPRLCASQGFMLKLRFKVCFSPASRRSPTSSLTPPPPGGEGYGGSALLIDGVVVAVAGRGGAGGSYIAPSVSEGAIVSAENAPQWMRERGNGSVTVTFCEAVA